MDELPRQTSRKGRKHKPPFYGLFFCDTMSESESKKAKLASDGSDTFLAIGPFIMKEEETQHEISAMH